MGLTSTIDVDKDGTSIWVAERCGANSCLDTATGQIKAIPTVMKFDTTIDTNDNLYVADSESGSVSQNHQDWKRGIRIGSLKDNKVTAFIPDPESRIRPAFTGTSAAEGVVVDSKGVIYGVEVGPRRVSRYVKK